MHTVVLHLVLLTEVRLHIQPIFHLHFVTAGLAGSNGEARRHIQGGAVRVNDQPVSDDRRVIGLADLSSEGVIKLSLGKKKHILVRPI